MTEMGRKILIAPDKFKGTLSATEAAEAIYAAAPSTSRRQLQQAQRFLTFLDFGKLVYLRVESLSLDLRGREL